MESIFRRRADKSPVDMSDEPIDPEDPELDPEDEEEEEEDPVPDNFLDAVAEVEDDDLPDQILFYPAIAQEIVAAYLEAIFETAGTPWSFLTVIRGGSYERPPENHVSVIAAAARPSTAARGRLVRIVPVTVNFATTRDIPIETAARYFSTIMLALQPPNLLTHLPETAAEALFPVKIAAAFDEGETHAVSDRGRIMSKTVALTLAHADIPPS